MWVGGQVGGWMVGWLVGWLARGMHENNSGACGSNSSSNSARRRYVMNVNFGPADDHLKNYF